MRENVLQLLKSCLLFDFIGTSPDELSEDSGTVQAPAAWRTDFEDADTVKVFFDCFAMFPTAQASQVRDFFIPGSLLSSYLLTLHNGFGAPLG
jgi:exportin-7